MFRLNLSRFFSIKLNLMKEAMKDFINTFMENFPITDKEITFVLEFLDYFVDPPLYNKNV
jgi:DNA-directed RNA polymerase subunit beta